MNRVWGSRRRNVRLWREIRRGKSFLRRNPEAMVPLPNGLVMISYDKYERLQSQLDLLREMSDAS